MKKDLTKVKTRLIELGYIDNEWLDKYLQEGWKLGASGKPRYKN